MNKVWVQIIISHRGGIPPETLRYSENAVLPTYHYYYITSLQNKSNKQMVKSKAMVENSWTVLKVILGHKYHHNH